MVTNGPQLTSYSGTDDYRNVITEKAALVLHSFSGSDGDGPNAGVILDPAGNLYGTTTSGGKFGGGTVFKLTRRANGNWTETVLHSFSGRDGITPYLGLVFDTTGNLHVEALLSSLSGPAISFGITRIDSSQLFR